MFSTVEDWLVRLGDHIGPWLYAILGALAFAEAGVFLGFVLPGETALLGGGFLARPGGGRLPGQQGRADPADHAGGGGRLGDRRRLGGLRGGPVLRTAAEAVLDRLPDRPRALGEGRGVPAPARRQGRVHGPRGRPAAGAGAGPG